MLRNKKTGEIKTLTEVIHEAYESHELDSLSKLNAEWEDYEPKTNSRFRLVKDLPTFKAGQEFHLSPKGNLVLNDGKFGICAYAKQTLEKFPNILEDWFEPIADESKKAIDTDKVNELIDKIHPEPIIIDKYPREAVRNWLYVVGGWDKVRIKYNEKTNAYLFTNETGYCIELNCDLRPCDLAKTYTLDELCGEEE